MRFSTEKWPYLGNGEIDRTYVAIDH